MYYGEKWLDLKIKEASKKKIKGNFKLNDLYLLISFKQIVPQVNSLKEINSLNLSYTLEDASTIPLLTNYLEDKGIFFQNKEHNLNLVEENIKKLHEIDLVEYLDEEEKWAIPREKIDFINPEGKYVVQAVKKAEIYKSKNLSLELFFEYPNFSLKE